MRLVRKREGLRGGGVPPVDGGGEGDDHRLGRWGWRSDRGRRGGGRWDRCGDGRGPARGSSAGGRGRRRGRRTGGGDGASCRLGGGRRRGRGLLGVQRLLEGPHAGNEE